MVKKNTINACPSKKGMKKAAGSRRNKPREHTAQTKGACVSPASRSSQGPSLTMHISRCSTKMVPLFSSLPYTCSKEKARMTNIAGYYTENNKIEYAQNVMHGCSGLSPTHASNKLTKPQKGVYVRRMYVCLQF